MPTITDIGVARPSAHGQAMISTDTAATSACGRRGSGPSPAQARKASTAIATTAGTNHAATASARRWTGARLRCASATRATMRASSVSRPTRSARITKPPVPLRVAPVTAEPGPFSTGIGSPLIIDSSTLVRPSSTTPSVGTRSPGRTRSRSPGWSASAGTSRSSPFVSIRRAVFTASPRSARIASPVRWRATSSSTWPSSTSVTITAADSK